MGVILPKRMVAACCVAIVLLSLIGCGGVGSRLAGAGGADAVAPAGVDEAVWAQLADELARVRAECGTDARAASTPPAGEAGAAVLYYFEPTSTLRWLYTNAGDYDQNGVVGVSDLTPLGMHFGEESPGGAGEPFPEESRGAAIDGNADGLIGIGDITPVGQNFGRRVAGYRIYVATEEAAQPATPDSPNGVGAALVAEVAFSQGDAGTGRLQFNRQVVPTQAEQYYWLRPYDGDEEGAASNGVHVTLPPDQAPEAALAPTGETATPAHIVWDASASDDPDGEIVKYEWDFDGDGVYEYDSHGAESVDFYYYAAGEYGCTVRVTDGDGMTDTAVVVVTVTESATWHDNVADFKFDFYFNYPNYYWGIKDPQLLEVEGRPALMYARLLDEYDPDIGSYYTSAYLRAADEHGETWPAPQSVPGSSGTGRALVVDGRPALLIERDLEYVSPPAPYRWEYWTIYTRAGDPNGAAWPIWEVISNHRTNGPEEWEGTRLDVIRAFFVVEGLPVIIGYGYPGGEGTDVFVQARNATGSSWPAEYSPISMSLLGTISYAAVNGKLAFLRRENSEDILYNLALEPVNGTWQEPSLVDHLERVDDVFWLLDTDGIPAAVYYEELQSTLKYRRALDASGSSWGEPVVLATAAGRHSHAAIVDGRPMVLYGDRIDDQVKLLAANDSQGRLWGFPSTVPFYPGDYPYVEGRPFAGVAGRPAFVYPACHDLQGEEHETQLHYVAYY
ncbi:hypothetical protein JW859_00720 [bacterium]|nr:hypothetical protein [bacterium]